MKEYCTSSDFESDFEEFAKEYSSVFVNALNYTSNDEHPHEFHEVYSAYLEHFESRIENFINAVIFNLIFLFF